MRRVIGGATLAALLLAAGCARKQASLPEPPPPFVEAVRPVTRTVTEYEYFTGRTEATEKVELRSRVTGYLVKAPLSRREAKNGEVKEGDDVQAGTLLFEIDPAPYEAEVTRAEANAKQYTALIDRLESDYRRGRGLVASKAMSREELDKVVSDKAVAQANLEAARAAQKLAAVNLAYTKINAPISGRLSRRMIDPGNLVKSDDTMLTTIVQLDPLHAYFDIDENTVKRLGTLLKDKKIESARTTTLRVQLGLDEKYDREGVIDFVDNQLDAGTGTLRIRVETPNPDLYLSPGMFIRLRLPVGKPREAMLVPEEALASKQGQKVVYVVRKEQKQKKNDKTGEMEPVLDDDGNPVVHDVVQEIPVVQGQSETERTDDGKARTWRVIKKSEGKAPLTMDDEVVVSGLLRVRPGRPVTVKR